MTGSIASGALLGTLYGIACVGAGAALAAILRRLMPSDESMPLRIATRFAMGHLVLGSLWTLVALGGRFDVALVAVVVALGAASAVWLAVLSARGGAAKEERDPRAPGWSRTALLFCALGAALVLLRSLAPPLNDDALRGYLVTARVVAETHELAFQPFNPFVIWPLLAEMNGAATLLLGNETAATIFDAWVALALLTAVAALSARAGLPPRGAWVAVLCLVSSSAFLGLVGAFKVDIAGALYGILAAVFCLQGRAVFPVPWLAGLFFGSSVAVKVSNLFLLPGLALLLWPRDAALPRRALAVFGLAGGLALAPQLLKNLSLVANPVAPFLGSWFGTADSYWTASLGGDIGGPADLTWVHRFLWPVILTYGGHTGMLGTVSPLLLGLLPFALRLGLPESGPRRLALAAFAILGAWFLVFPWGLIFPRFLFTPVALLSVAAGAIAERMWEAGPFRSVVRAAIGLCLAMAVFDLRSTAYSLQYAAGVRSRAETYARQENARPWFGVAELLNRDVSGAERAFLEMPYGYFLRLDILQGSQTAGERQRAVASCEARARVLREGGFTHLVQPTEEFQWLVAPSPACPLPPGFRVVQRTPSSIVAVSTAGAVPADPALPTAPPIGERFPR